eukprot:CAMPEP_0178986398 /NCGR_PEP_ID=MMETSP0795-20121207/2682_1 /TAXON_ID=88552 /ORGANISM="Amoebophrya sp., Strain Ameob2" /LENGTH=189 /DNA_ID=CAMNT_0020677455 /DNA_START=719 /DNA_END=1285 /DNA_ORIENTATION=+
MYLCFIFPLSKHFRSDLKVKAAQTQEEVDEPPDEKNLVVPPPHVDLDAFYPRCYNLSCDTDAFIEDFKRGKCLAILKTWLIDVEENLYSTEDHGHQSTTTSSSSSEMKESLITDEVVTFATEALERKLKSIDEVLEEAARERRYGLDEGFRRVLGANPQDQPGQPAEETTKIPPEANTGLLPAGQGREE